MSETTMARLSLMERAKIAADEDARVRAESERERITINQKDETENLVAAVERWLAVAVDVNDVRHAGGEGPTTITIDGQQFAIIEHGSYDYSRRELSVATACAKGCGSILWESVEYGDPFVRLYEVLNDKTLAHHWICAQKPFSVLPARPEPRDPAQAAVERIVDAADMVAQAHATVMRLEDERPLIKARCIEQMLGTPNPITNKPHSATSAEAIVEKHQEYWAHRRAQEAAEVEKHRAIGLYAAAVRMADLEIAAYRAATRAE